MMLGELVLTLLRNYYLGLKRRSEVYIFEGEKPNTHYSACAAQKCFIAHGWQQEIAGK